MSDGDSNARKARLSERCLAVVVGYCERQWGEKGTFNVPAARAARDAAHILGLQGFAARLNGLLDHMTVADLLSGAITSIQPTGAMAKPLQRRTLDEINEAHPLFTDFYVQNLLSTGGNHLRPCLDRNYGAALLHATSELDEVEIALSQILLGDFDAARASFVRFPKREHDMLVVLAIESCRRNRLNEAEEVCATLLDQDPVWAPIHLALGTWHLALGVANRVPWPCYPFPDY